MLDELDGRGAEPEGAASGQLRPPGRVARRQDQTRRHLRQTARTLIAQRGLAGLTIGELTESADIGHGSFYSYFASKDQLIEAVLNDGIQTLAAIAITAVPEHEDPAVRASVADRRFLRMASADPELASLLIQAHDGGQLMHASTFPYAQQVLQLGLDSGRFHVPDLQLALETLIASAFALLRSMLAGTAAPDAAESHAELVLRMLGIPWEEAHVISRRALDL